MSEGRQIRGIWGDLVRLWRSLPGRTVFVVLLAAWLALFHFLGNSTFGYLKDASLFAWMYYVFTTSPDDDFCLYIPLVVAGLLVWKRQELIATTKRLWWPGLALVAGALLLHVAGYAVQQARVSIVALVVGLYGLTGLCWGPAWLRNSFFPMFLLLFLVPIASVSDGITLPLRLLATKVSVGVASTGLGIEVYENGAQILGPTGMPLYEVAPACSGIRSLMSMIVLMLIYGFLTFQTWWRRLLLLASAVPVAIVGNILRLIIVIVVGEAFGQDQAVAVEQNLGFVTFALGIGCMLLLGHWLREPGESAPPPPATPALAPS
jgi:exosortase